MGDSPGQRLEAARQQRGLTIDDVARSTKMRARQIRDLEADNYRNFPNLAYARGFLKIYAKYLHLDLGEAIERLHPPERIGVEDYQYLNVPLDNVAPYRPSLRSRRRSSSPSLRSGSGSIVKWLIFTVITLPLVALLAVFAVNLQRLDLGKTAETGDATPAVETLATPSASPATEKPVADTPAPEANPSATTPPRALPVHPPNVFAPLDLDGTSVATGVESPAAAPLSSPTPGQPEIRRAQPVRPLPQ